MTQPVDKKFHQAAIFFPVLDYGIFMMHLNENDCAVVEKADWNEPSVIEVTTELDLYLCVTSDDKRLLGRVDPDDYLFVTADNAYHFSEFRKMAQSNPDCLYEALPLLFEEIVKQANILPHGKELLEVFGKYV